MSNNKLPADPLALILGIFGIFTGICGCCLLYGITSIIPLIISIIGIVVANKSMRLYKEKPEEYSESSRSNVSVGRILNIISVVFNGVIFLIVIVGLLFFGTFFYKMFDVMKEEGVFDKDYPYKIETIESDSIDNYEDIYEIEEIEKDTLIIDSTMIEDMFEEVKEIETIENKIE